MRRHLSKFDRVSFRAAKGMDRLAGPLPGIDHLPPDADLLRASPSHGRVLPPKETHSLIDGARRALTGRLLITNDTGAATPNAHPIQSGTTDPINHYFPIASRGELGQAKYRHA